MPNPLTIQVYAQTSAVMSWPSVTLQVPDGCKIISGGAKVNGGSGWGNMLIASYPLSPYQWFAQSKDTAGNGDPRSITAYVVTVYDPNNAVDVQITSTASGVAPHPVADATVNVAAAYKLTGGGARTTVGTSGQGNFLTASYPLNAVQWRAAATDHLNADPSAIFAYAIGIFSSALGLRKFTIGPASSPTAQHPSVTASVSSVGALLGGGAIDNWSGAGNMLTASHPACTFTPGPGVVACSAPTGWTAAGQDYAIGSPSSITAYCVELNVN